MSKINIKLPEGTPIVNGKQISFKAPCNCSEVTGLIIEGISYELFNTSQYPVVGWNVFTKDVLVTVTIDTELHRAYIQSNNNGVLYKYWTSAELGE